VVVVHRWLLILRVPVRIFICFGLRPAGGRRRRGLILGAMRRADTFFSWRRDLNTFFSRRLRTETQKIQLEGTELETRGCGGSWLADRRCCRCCSGGVRRSRRSCSRLGVRRSHVTETDYGRGAGSRRKQGRVGPRENESLLRVV